MFSTRNIILNLTKKMKYYFEIFMQLKFASVINVENIFSNMEIRITLNICIFLYISVVLPRDIFTL